jgi:hypothetical protein
VAFHLEIRHSYHRAREFNLSEVELRERVLEPWRRGAIVRAGDRDWEPAKSALRVIEGPELAPEDLAHGQGWHRAESTGRDVAAELLAASGSAPAGAAARLVVLTSGDDAAALAADALRDSPWSTEPWPPARAALLRGDAGPAAALIVLGAGEPSGDWLFDAGVALGALGPRALLVLAGRDLPAELAGVASLRLDPEDPAPAQTLASRLHGPV